MLWPKLSQIRSVVKEEVDKALGTGEDSIRQAREAKLAAGIK